MIVGVGTDIVELKRVEKACGQKAFFTRCFTVREQEEMNRTENGSGRSAQLAAGDFAVKEEVAKALGSGFRGFRPGDIEVLRNELGAPYVTLFGGAKTRAGQLAVTHWHVSISHTDTVVIAFAVAESRADGPKEVCNRAEMEG